MRIDVDCEIVDPEDKEGTPAWRRAVFRVLEREGKVTRTTEIATDPDGVRRFVYVLTDEREDLEKIYHSAEIQHALDGLERQGLIMKTGEYRIDSDNLYSPVYITTEHAHKH